MDKELEKIIRKSNYEVIPGRFIYAKVSSIPKKGNHFMVSQDKDEITVVTTEDKLNDVQLIERNKDNYSLIALNVSVPFYSVGLLAVVSDAIAQQKMDILIISTYSKDYILIKDDQIDKARSALNKLGFEEK